MINFTARNTFWMAVCCFAATNLAFGHDGLTRAEAGLHSANPAASFHNSAVTYSQAGPAVTVACDPADLSDDILAAMQTLKAVGGGTIYLPVCDAQFLTTIGSSSANGFPGGINVIGQGVEKTILRSDGSTFFDINHWGSHSAGLRISGISFIGVPAGGTGAFTNHGIEISNVVDFRIDHCSFDRILYNILVRSPAGFPQSRGVVDHNTFYARGLTAYGVSDTRVWDADMKLGTAEAVFIEDNYFDGFSHAAASFDGGHYVLRHSVIANSTSIDAHGPGFGCCGRGARASEIYENEIYHDPGNTGWTAIGLRAGGGVIFNNTFRNFDHAYRLSIDTAGYNATGGVYPTLDQPHDLWIWDDTLVDITFDPSRPGYQDNFDNPSRTTVSGVMLYSNNAGVLIRKDRDFHMRAPSLAQDGFVYTPYVYPHPLIRDLVLTGAPLDRAIRLNWDVLTSLPSNATWTIAYAGPPGDPPSPITGIAGSARGYLLTGLTNHTLYAVTLEAIVDGAVVLSQTIQVMPSDLFTYLPMVGR